MNANPRLPSTAIAPQRYARADGVLYLLLIVLGFFLQFVLNKVVVSGDAAATATNLVANETLWRLGIGAELVALVCVITLAMIYFVLLRPVNRELNLLATFLRLIGIAVEVVATLFLAVALFPLGNTPALKSFSAEQLNALTGLAIKSHAYGYSLALLLFGFCFLIHGRLIFKSGFLPKILGILIQIRDLNQ